MINLPTLLANSGLKTIIYILILSGMLLLTWLLIVPYLEEFEKLPEESEMQSIMLPEEDGNIRYYFDTFDTDEVSGVEIVGWAFIDGEDTPYQLVFIVLDSEESVYVFETSVQPRPDVSKHFKETNLDLDMSGFQALIPVRLIRNGEYRVGIYIRKGEIEALTYTPRRIVKSQGLIHKQAE